MGDIINFSENFYILEDGRVRQFLICGEKEALLIDTGFPDSHVPEDVRKITDLPVKVILTHGDMDHTGGLKDFGECWLNQRDWHLIPEGIKLHDIREGDVFSCGGYRLEALEIPGHTFGSIAFADRKKSCCCQGIRCRKRGRSLCLEIIGAWICIWKARKNFWGSWNRWRVFSHVITNIPLDRSI